MRGSTDKQLHRRSVEQYEWDVQLKERCQLQQGDLVFFRTPNSSEQCDHVGIFLKDDKVHPRWWSWS